jgi:Cadherin-like domain/RTX calcium-binding nonapeptide repeat (4 copies)
MPSYAPLGSETLVNTNTADGQIAPRIVPLSGGKYMVVWIGSVILPVVQVNGTIAPSYVNADIRAQIYNADGTPSGGEIIINTTTAGGQLSPEATVLSDGNILITWQDGLGFAGGPAETVASSIRGQEFTSAGVATGGEVTLVNAGTMGNGYSIAANNDGGFVLTYNRLASAGSNANANLVGQIFNANNAAVGAAFVIDSSDALLTPARVTVEADNDIIIAWSDRSAGNFGQIVPTIARYSAAGVFQSTIPYLNPSSTVADVFTLATGGHAIVFTDNLGVGAPVPLYVVINNTDGTLREYVAVTTLPPGAPLGFSAAPTPSGGFVVTWVVDTDPTTAVVLDTYAQAFNAIGNPIGEPFQVNTTTVSSQSGANVAALSNGDLVIAFVDGSATGGDTSSTAIRLQRYDYDPTNRAPTASDFSLSLGDAVSAPFTIDPSSYTEFLGTNGYDVDGDPLIVSAVSNVANGTVSLQPDGTLTITVAANATGPLAFDYTVSDGQGGTATARATLTFPNDFVTLGAGETATINFLANDFYVPSAGATAFTLSPPSPVFGGAAEGIARIVSTPGGPQIFYDPLGEGTFGIPALTSSYFNLTVGQTTLVNIFYNNNETGGQVTATLQGWAQLGGTGADVLTGNSGANHLSGGTGAGNYLIGGAGNDWYTVRTATDAILELAGGGIDSVRTDQAFFALNPNIENLYFIGAALNQGAPPAAVVGIGNDLGNFIYAREFTVGHQLYGLGGNDTIIAIGQQSYISGGDGNDNIGVFGSTPGTTILLGGMGDDIFNVDSSAYIVEYAGQGFDTVRASQNIFIYNDSSIERIETATPGSTQPIALVGNNLAQQIVGNAGNNQIEGREGSDTLTGGLGQDYFYFTTAIGADVDQITDFTSVDDILMLDDGIFAGVATGFLSASAFLSGAGATSATNATQRFIHNSTTGDVYYDADGSGGVAAVKIANIGADTPMAHYDIFVY